MGTVSAGPQRKLPKQSRTIPVKGGGEDRGRYFRCWNCGFICDTQRDNLGGPASKGGAIPSEYALHAYGDYSTDSSTYPSRQTHPTLTQTVDGGLSQYEVEYRGIVLGDSIEHFHTILRNDATDSAKSVRHTHYGNGKAGGPFCGSRTYRGDY